MWIIRPEEKAVLLWNQKTSGTAYISGEELLVLKEWAVSGMETRFVHRLKKMSLISDEMRQDMLRAVKESESLSAPKRSFCAPESLHIEVTTNCPLNCPQCYKEGYGKQDLSYDKLQSLLKQAEAALVFQIAFGGGEPLSYPHLEKAIEEVSSKGMSCSITTSGFGLDKSKLSNLSMKGLNHIQISLNGSTEEIHRRSRDGYCHGIHALQLLSKQKVSYGINWVARRDNLYDLPNMFRLAKDVGAGNVNILRYKPSQGENYSEFELSLDEQLKLVDMIQDSRDITIKVDSAYSNLLCHLNGRSGTFSGCGAGRRFLAVDAGGYFRPCSHVKLEEKEKIDNLMEYWFHSKQLIPFRQNKSLEEPCISCYYVAGCGGCKAIEKQSQCAYYRKENMKYCK